MSSPIHYDEDIFFVSEILRQLRRGCGISIDSDFFLDKIVEDILFADNVLKTLYSRLNPNELLVDRRQYLRDLYLAKRQLVNLLDDLNGSVLEFSGHLEAYKPRFTSVIRSQKEEMMAIDDELNGESRQQEAQAMVSEAEYSILLKEQSTEEEQGKIT